jgi:hypothetical protein
MTEVSGMTFRRVFLAATPITFGIGAGTLILSIVLGVVRVLYTSQGAGAPLAGLSICTHAAISLSSLAAGTSASWLLCWHERAPRIRRLSCGYASGVALLWTLVLAASLWRSAVLAWPLFLVDLLFIALAGVLGRRISQ